MLLHIFNITITVFFSVNSFAQISFKGRVLNQSGDKPIAGASVYFNNTSIGSTTNEKGEFSIINVPGAEVVISSVGFERLIYKLNPNDVAGKSFTFKLEEKQPLLRDVLILPDALRKRYLQLFKENFLGLTEEADLSRITNIDAINFAGTGTKKSFIAYSDTPLTILNRKLGYNITFDLVEFYFNELTGETSFYGYTRYEELGDKKRWAKNRRKAYLGSSLHFFRALIGNRLEAEHFSVLRLREDSIKQQGQMGTVIYKKIDVGIPVTVPEIIKKDSSENRYVASWKDRLMVHYFKDPDSKHYLSKKILLREHLPTGAKSYLKLNAENIHIDSYGIIADPLNILFSGYWIYEKAANLLPFNYYPDTQ